MDKYIFPDGMIPSIAQLGQAMEGLWVVEDWHNFGPDYDKTLMAWWENFERAWPILRSKSSERFYRMWKYYQWGAPADSALASFSFGKLFFPRATSPLTRLSGERR